MADSSERAARLALVQPPQQPQGVGGWKWRIAGHGREIQLRNKRLPHLRLDLTTSEAFDLAKSLSVALEDAASMPVVRLSWWRRCLDWMARRAWNRTHDVERMAALSELAKDFRESKGGWL